MGRTTRLLRSCGPAASFSKTALKGRYKLDALSRARNAGANLETALYLPVKRFLESLGFTVKGEVGGCDLVALSGDEPPIVVIGELKLTFNLELLLQAVDRAGACDEVWLAAKLSSRGKGRESDARYRNLCRRLGFGMRVVEDTGEGGGVVKRERCAISQSCRRVRFRHARGDEPPRGRGSTPATPRRAGVRPRGHAET